MELLSHVLSLPYLKRLQLDSGSSKSTSKDLRNTRKPEMVEVNQARPDLELPHYIPF
jgi:hypothetical protein